MQWMKLCFQVPAEHSEAMEDALLAIGAAAVTLEDDADQPIYEPVPGTAPVWDQTRITGLFDASCNVPQLVALLELALGAPPPTHSSEILEDKDWTREWMKDYHPMRFGERLWICPSWEDPPVAEAVNLMLDPGLAFGSGTHPTTALCLEWLDSQEIPGKSVADYGCGSGVLAIAALLLGANSAMATDIDPQALQATEENLKRNQLAPDLMRCYLPDKLPEQHYDIVMANILAGPLKELSPTLLALLKPGGQLVLSGILVEQAAEVRKAYEPAITFDADRSRDGWVRLTGQRKL